MQPGLNLFGLIVLIVWIPVVLVIFLLLPPRRAVIAGFLFAWLFLPMAELGMEGLPKYNKMTATCVGVLLATALFDYQRLLKFRPSWLDIPMGIWCVCPLASSLTNDLGIYDGLSGTMYQTIAWGVPYFIGRAFFSDWEGLRELATGIFIGGLVYVPLCLYEVRMSPQLHTMFYGYHQHVFAQAIRWGGFRPTVFMQHGLMVGMWMAMATLIGAWLWRTKAVGQVFGLPVALLVLGLLVTTVLCKSVAAMALLGIGLLALFLGQWVRPWMLLVALLMAPPAYMTVRLTGLVDRDRIFTAVAQLGIMERADSLDNRMVQEDILGAKALQQPIFGWGGWGRNYTSESGVQMVNAIDSLWIIAVGQRGLVGLGSLYASLLLPPLVLALRHRGKALNMPAVAPGAALAMVIMLHATDCLVNAMLNPIFILALGGLASTARLPAPVSSPQPQLAWTRGPVAAPRALAAAAGPQRPARAVDRFGAVDPRRRG